MIKCDNSKNRARARRVVAAVLASLKQRGRFLPLEELKLCKSLFILRVEWMFLISRENPIWDLELWCYSIYFGCEQ